MSFSTNRVTSILIVFEADVSWQPTFEFIVIIEKKLVNLTEQNLVL